MHLKITIEGVEHAKVFEADPDIKYTYAWDRLNEYRQVTLGSLILTISKLWPQSVVLKEWM